MSIFCFHSLSKLLLLSSIVHLPFHYLSSATATADKPQAINSKYPDVVSCLKAIGDEVSTSSSAGWADVIKPYNLRIAPVPAAMVFPKTSTSVQAIMSCARLFPSTRLAPLCGGHSFASFGLGGVDGAVVVNMQHFKQITMLPSVGGLNIVSVGGGVLVRELTQFLIQNGGLSWPHARYTEVGVVGSAIGGGFGPSSRLVGTTLDNVVAVNIILPNGNLTRATAKDNAELYFAVLGAGSSFGIIVSIELSVHKAPYSNPVQYMYTWGQPTLENAITAFTNFQDFGIKQAPPELSIRLSFGLPSNMNLYGVYYGDIKDFSSVMKPILSKLPAPKVANVTSTTFAESEAAYTGPLESAPAVKIHGVTYTRSLLGFEPLPLPTIKTFLSDLANRSDEKRKSDNFQVQHFIDLWGGYNSFSSKMDPKNEAYSFPHNQALFLIRGDGVLLNSTSPQNWPADAISFTKSFTDELFLSQSRPRSYPNYRDSAYTEAEWSSRYYDQEFGKLQRIKAHIDPIGIMSANPQSIQPNSFTKVHNPSHNK